MQRPAHGGDVSGPWAKLPSRRGLHTDAYHLSKSGALVFSGALPEAGDDLGSCDLGDRRR